MLFYAAREMGHTYIGSEHILIGLLSEPESAGARLLEGRSASLNEVKELVRSISGTGDKSSVTPADMTPRTKNIIENSAYISVKYNQGYIGTEHILYALLNERDCVAVKILETSGVSVDDLRADTENFAFREIGRCRPHPAQVASDARMSSQGRFSNSDIPGGMSGFARRDGGRSKIKNAPTLSNYGRDLCALAREGKLDPIIGRENEMERVIQILSRRTKK